MVNQLTQFVRRHIKLLAALALIICAVLLYCVNPVGHTFVPKCAFKLITGTAQVVAHNVPFTPCCMAGCPKP